MRTKTHARLFIIAASAALLGTGAQADTGTLLLTGGVSTIEGAAGGGLSPWVVIGSNATQGEIGGSAYLTNVGTKDYGLNVYGAALGIENRFELSVAQQDLNTRGTGTALDLARASPEANCCGCKGARAG